MSTEVSQDMFFWNTADNEKEYFTGAYHALPVLGHTGSSETAPAVFCPGVFRIVNSRFERISNRPKPSKGRVTATGKVIHNLEQTKEMDFPYPLEPDL